MNPVKTNLSGLPAQLPYHFSPAHSNYLNKLIEVHLAKQMLKKMRQKCAKSGLPPPNQKRKRGCSNKRSKLRSMRKSYDKCECIQKLNSLAQEQAYNLQDLLKEKERLRPLIKEQGKSRLGKIKIYNEKRIGGTNERLKFYTQNEKATREAYFIEQVQRRNLQILYLEEKLKQKRERYSSERKSLEVKLQKKIKEKKNLKKNANM